MPRTHIVREIDTPKSFRVAQVSSMFDVTLQEKTRHEWTVDLPLHEKEWQIGLIVGPSGSGKTTIAKELWSENYTRGYTWNEQSILDNFPQGMESKQVVAALTSVGFSSPPDWVKPYHVLSTGQQMRCDLARALCSDGLVVFDEFTSVVDRTVAQIGSVALAKAVRKQQGRQFIAVTCHEDVLDWLTPDWTYEPHVGIFNWRYLQRPSIEVQIYPVHTKAWPLFGQYHYMNTGLNPSSKCFLAEWRGEPVAFMAVLPDYQGVGIGIQLADFVAEYYKQQGKRFRRTFSHPAVVSHCSKSIKWKLVDQKNQGFTNHHGIKSLHSLNARIKTSKGRAVVTFEYVG